ncbi:MAG: TonB-dependent receptor [Bacteroidetes bacterium]|nr:TonB-dependent receptor [Bacteroidota bacterium]
MYPMKINFLNTFAFFIFNFFFSQFLQSQTVEIKGKVTDMNQEPLIGATILVQGSEQGTITDINGNFQLKTDPNVTLIISYTGFSSKIILVGNQTVWDIILEPEDLKLDEVVVIGYGSQRKSQITGAISSLKGKDIQDQPVSNLANSMQGRVAGLNVMSASGTPGAGLLVNVRGNNAPLYVVDGIPLLSESNSGLSTSFDLQGQNVGSGQTLSSISDINPNDIESIEVLKDASAAAIYGARAANGVILISTKRGKSGRQEANFNIYSGIQQIARPIKFMDSKEMVNLIEEARANDLAIFKKDPSYFGDNFDPSVLTDPLDNFDLSSELNTNWLNEVSRLAPINNYEFSFRAGNEKTKYFTSLGYFDQQGVIIENYYKRFNYRLNLDHEINSRFKFGVTFNTTYSKNRRSFNDNTYTGIITNALGASPLMPPFEEDGSYASFEDYQANWLSDNPVKSAKEIRAFTNGYRALGTLAGEYKFSNKLYFKSSLSADVNFNFDNQFKSPLTADAEAFGGESYEGNFRNVTWLNENTLHFADTKNGNTLSLLGGVTMQRTQINRSNAVGQGFPPGALERISSAANIINATSEGTSFALLSFISRINYDIKNRFLFTFTSRADGSSRFSKNNRFGFFPSGAVAWRISKEPFFNSLKQVFSDFKVRMSAGLTGDQEIGDFQNITFYAASRYAGRSGYQLRNLADPDLTWQTNSMFNIGIDYEMADGKIGGSIEFFNSLKYNLLSEDLIPATTGFTSITRNGGEVQNVGLEFNVNASLVNKKIFTWDLNFNATWIHNEIKSLNSDGVFLNAYDDLEATHILQIGYPVGSFLGLKYLGVDPETGDVQFEDFNEDGNIDYDDAQIIGKAMPDWYGGLTNVFKWKNLDFSIFSRFSVGNQVYNLIRGTTENLGWSNDGGLSSIYANNTLNVRERWKKPGDNTEYGRASFINLNLGLNSSQMVENASFFRIQNINAGYSLPNPGKFSSVRIYAEVQNLWILTSYKGFDPEVSSNGGLADRTAGVDYGAYPSARTFLIGFSLKF